MDTLIQLALFGIFAMISGVLGAFFLFLTFQFSALFLATLGVI